MTVRSFGCRMNLAEGDALAAGLGDRDDLVVLNTCGVTNAAMAQARAAVRRAHREQPGATLIVTGCAAALEPAAFAAMPGVTRVVPNAAKLALREGVAAASPPRHTRAFVDVQHGCDHACTFCIIPRARGPARSTPLAEVVARIAALDAAEAVLTGIDLSAWGRDLPGAPALGTLVQAILARTALPRLRLSSLDPAVDDPALLEALADPRVMPHLHLSLQAGDDLILKRMRRRHSSAAAVRLTERLRRARPDIALGADLIAGFPTESDAAFAASLAHIDACGLTMLHVFPYSPRDGTPAARMPQVPAAVRRDRAARLRAHGETRLAAALAAQLGRPQRILVERSGLTGRTEHFLPARLARPQPRGGIVTAVAVAATGGVLDCA